MFCFLVVVDRGFVLIDSGLVLVDRGLVLVDRGFVLHDSGLVLVDRCLVLVDRGFLRVECRVYVLNAKRNPSNSKRCGCYRVGICHGRDLCRCQ